MKRENNYARVMFVVDYWYCFVVVEYLFMYGNVAKSCLVMSC